METLYNVINSIIEIIVFFSTVQILVLPHCIYIQRHNLSTYTSAYICKHIIYKTMEYEYAQPIVLKYFQIVLKNAQPIVVNVKNNLDDDVANYSLECLSLLSLKMGLKYYTKLFIGVS